MRHARISSFMLPIAILMMFILGSTAALGADFRKGPYLQYRGVNTEMTVLWQLDDTEECLIEWGTDTSYSLGSALTEEYGDPHQQGDVSDHQHRYNITNLTPGTQYFYRVTATTAQLTGSFFTAPDESATKVKFTAYSDTYTFPDSHNYVAGGVVLAYTNDPEFQTFLLAMGSLVNKGTIESDWDEQFFDPTYPNIQSVLQNLPFQSCVGSRDMAGNGPDLFAKYFRYPWIQCHYWSFDYGPVHIAVVDQTVDYSTDSAQHVWLENDLAATTKPWKIVCLHAPGWSAGEHENNLDVQNYIQPLCEQYGVQLVMAGHNHYYARASVNGVQHVTTGGGGAPLSTPDPEYPNILVVKKYLHYCKIDIDGSTLRFSACKPNGNIIDLFLMANNVAPDIKVNGSDGPLSITTTDTATATVSLDPGDWDNQFADWWIYVTKNPNRTWWCKFDSGPKWHRQPTPLRFLAITLRPVNDYTILSPRTLPEGTYEWTFCVDEKNGILEHTHVDKCELTVTP